MKSIAVAAVSLCLVACGSSARDRVQPAQSPSVSSSYSDAEGITPVVAKDDDASGLTSGSDASCRSDELCALSGLCSHKAGECVAASDAACEASKQCRTDGACTAQDGECVASSDAMCKASEACRRERRCLAIDGFCTRRRKRG